jgi:hypothetical protein
MSQELVEAFFKRDLSPAERQDLMALAASDPEASQKLMDLADQAYQRTGLPQPQPPKADKQRWLLAAAVALGMLMGAGAGLYLGLGASKTSQAQIQSMPQSEPAQPKKAVKAAADLRLGFTVKALNRLNANGFVLSVRMPANAHAELWAENKGQMQPIFTGKLDEGRHDFNWQSQISGNWRLCLKSLGQTHEQWVWVEQR